MKDIRDIVLRTILPCIVTLAPFSFVHAQNADESLKERWLERVQGATDEESTSDQTLWEERWSERTSHPLNFNTLTRTQLESMCFLSDVQMEAILNFTRKYGEMKSFAELFAIPELNPDDRQLLQNFTYLGAGQTADSTKISLQNLLTRGENTFVIGTDIPFYTRKGYTNGAYEGSNLHHTFRYQYNYQDKVLWGIQGDKDAGEPFFRSWNRMGFDYYGYYVMLNNIGRIQRLVVGDYRLSFGQGLVVNNNMSFGKSSDIFSQNIDRGIQKHSSTGEVEYFEGAALTVGLGRLRGDETPWNISLFASRRNLDANVNSSGEVTSWKTDGYHRTESEHNKRRLCLANVYGGHIGFQNRHFTLGTTGMAVHYGRNLSPSNLYYKVYSMRGTNFFNASVDYAYTGYPFAFRGESAINESGHFALLHKLGYYVNTRLQFFVSHRYYDKEYTAPYASSVSTTSGVQNEQGIYAGTLWKPSYTTTIQGYVDYFRFPSPVYGCRYASDGVEYLLKGEFATGKNTRLMLSYKSVVRQKSYTLSDDTPLLNYDFQHRIQARFTATPGTTVSSVTSASVSLVKKYATDMEKGWSIAERISYTPNKKLRISCHLSYFHTDDYNARVYVYEPTLSYGSSFGSLYGIGQRYALLCAYAPCKRIKAEVKYGITKYNDRTEISSGNQLIASSVKQDLSVLCTVKL